MIPRNRCKRKRPRLRREKRRTGPRTRAERVETRRNGSERSERRVSLPSTALPAPFVRRAAALGRRTAFLGPSARNVQARAHKGLLPSWLRGERGSEATPAPALLFRMRATLARLRAPGSGRRTAMCTASQPKQHMCQIRDRWVCDIYTLPQR